MPHLGQPVFGSGNIAEFSTSVADHCVVADEKVCLKNHGQPPSGRPGVCKVCFIFIIWLCFVPLKTFWHLGTVLCGYTPLAAFWVHSGSLLGRFLVNLAVFRCCFVVLLHFVLSSFFFLFFGVCG